MANAVRDHFHIWAVGGTFTGTTDHEYHILLPGIRDTPLAIVSHVRSLNGTSHTHVLSSGGGPILVKDAVIRVLATLAERDALAALQGRACYYIPINHMADTDAHDDAYNVPLSPGYAVHMLPISEDQNIDPMLAYWVLALTLKDNSI